MNHADQDTMQHYYCTPKRRDKFRGMARSGWNCSFVDTLKRLAFLLRKHKSWRIVVWAGALTRLVRRRCILLQCKASYIPTPNTVVMQLMLLFSHFTVLHPAAARGKSGEPIVCCIPIRCQRKPFRETGRNNIRTAIYKQGTLNMDVDRWACDIRMNL